MARALLGAREPTWARTLLASVIGLFFGIAMAAFILIDDFEAVDDLDPSELQALALPLAIGLGTVSVVLLISEGGSDLTEGTVAGPPGSR